MQIKTTDGEKNVASQATGGTALGFGIAGTALALLNGGNGFGGGLLGGLFGGNAAGLLATHDSRAISALESALAKEQSERYADKIGIDVYKELISVSNREDEKINANYRELAAAVAALDKQTAVNQQAITDNLSFVNHRIDETKKEILCYCNATFVPGKLVMPLSSICPEAMQRYNSWTAPTTGTTASEAA